MVAVGLVLRQVLTRSSIESPRLARTGEPRHSSGSLRTPSRPSSETQDSTRYPSAEADVPRCDAIAVFDAAYEVLPSSAQSKALVAEARRAPTDWIVPSLACAERNGAAEGRLLPDSDALLDHISRRLVEDRSAFRRALLASALDEHCHSRLGLWSLLLTRYLSDLCLLEESFLEYSLEILPDFRGARSDPRLPAMLEGATAVVLEAEVCCGRLDTLFSWLADKFPSELVLVQHPGLDTVG